MATPEKTPTPENNFKKSFLKTLGFIALLAVGANLLGLRTKPPQPK